MKNLATRKLIVKAHKFCKNYNIENYTINSDGSIDVDGDVNLENSSFPNGHLEVEFDKVSGNFYIHRSNLKSLNGCPIEVGGDFDCSYSNIRTLDGCPDSVGGCFECIGNPIKTLKGFTLVPGNGCKFGLNDFPEPLADFLDDSNDVVENSERLRVFLKYHKYFYVWDTKFNKEACQLLIDEIKTGLL